MGVPRTKPGRLDSDPSLCMSCSDKMLKWLNVGLSGALLDSLGVKLHLDSITIGDLFEQDALQRALGGRIDSVCSVPIHQTKVPFKYSRPTDGEFQTADTCCIWIFGEMRAAYTVPYVPLPSFPET